LGKRKPYTLIASLLLGQFVQAQPCSINLGNDTTICQGQSVTLTAPPGFPNYLWSNGSTNQSITVNSGGIYWGEASYPSPQLFPNSDFSAGNTGFSSDFTASTTLTSDGNYWIGTNPNTYHGQFFGTGNGNFMMVNSGWPSALWNVYCQSVTVCPEQTYTLSYRVRTISNATPARLQWWINGGPVGPEVNLPAFNAGWQTITQAWTSGAGVTNANLCLRVMSGEGVGNDFGLDDITMQGTIRLRDHKEVTVTPLPAFDLGPNATLCNGQNLVLDAAVPGGTYVWQDGSTLPDYVVSGPGIYSVTVTANGCSAVDGIIVNYNALPVVDLGPDLSLCDGNTRVLSATTPGGSYIWQDGSTASTFNVTGPGTYSVQVTVNNCPATDAVDIAYNPYPVVDLGVDIAACDGDVVTLDATTPSATYQWSDGSGMATLNVSSTASPSVQVTVDGCTTTDAINVLFNPNPVVDLGPDQTVCPGTSVLLDATTAGATYLWQDGSTNATFIASTPGIYTVDVTVNGCTTSDSFTLSNFTLQTVDLGPDLTICQGQGITIGTTVAGATYLWSTGATTNTIGVSTAGTYWLDVTLNGCVVRDEVDVSVTPLPTFDLGVDRTICPGTTNLLDATVVGATYAWNTGATTPTINVGPGNYSVTVTANGCSRTDAITIDTWPAPTVDLGADVTLCPGTPITLDATLSGATYTWQDGSTNPTFTTNTAGTYSVTRTDGNGCISTDAINVNYDAPTPIDLGNDVVLCQGDVITLDATVAGATYAWSTGATAATINVSTAGNYSVVVTQGNCTVSDAIVVQVETLPTVELGADQVLCPGETTVLDVTGPGLSYVWSNGATTPTITVSTGGIYSVTVTNAAGCSATDVVVITYATPGAVELGPDVALCSGESSTLDATLAGATYLWNTGATTPTLTVNTAGTYSVVVTQGNCTVNDAVNVVVNAMPEVDLGNDVTLCANEDITLDATWPGATYTWSTGATSASIVANASGTYSVVVTSNGCVATDAIDVTVLSATALNIGPDATICAGDVVTLDATTSGATYAWSNGATTPTIDVSTSGTYSVVVTSGQCSATDEATITVNAMPVVDLGNDVTLCANEDITLDATWPGATYAWNTGATSATIVANASGTYSVVVTSNGCVATDAIDVTVLSATAVNIGPDATICAGEVVTLDATTPGATYAWSNGATTPTIDVTTSGTYSVVVTSGQCSVSDEATVTVNLTPMVDLGSDLVFCGGETSATLDAFWPSATYAWNNGATTPTIDVTTDGTYEVTVSLGDCSSSDAINVAFGSFSYDLGPDLTLCPGETVDLGADLPAGNATWNNTVVSSTYTITTEGQVTLHFVSPSGCDVRDTIMVDYIDVDAIDLGPDVTACAGESVVLDATLAGATHLWNDGSTDAVRTITSPGTYSVEAWLTGCWVSDEINIAFTPLPLVDLGPDRSICPGDATSFDATTAGASYLWSDGSTEPTLLVNSAGTRTVTVTVNGCSATDAAEVFLLDAPVVDLGEDTTICEGADLLLNVEEANTSFIWDDGSNTPTRSISAAGVYWVDALRNSCTHRDSIVVEIFSPSSFDLGNDQVICAGTTTEIGTPVNGASYLWNNGATTPRIVVDASGEYAVTVSISGCSAAASMFVDVITVAPPDLGPDRRACEGEWVNVYTPGSNVTWSNGTEGNELVVGSTGLYTATVDSLGCTASDAVFISFTPMTTTLDLDGDVTICPGSMAVIHTEELAGASYLWSTGATGRYISVSEPGWYSVRATGLCIDATDSMQVIHEDCNTYVYVPNAFTPNNDGENDVFLPVFAGPLDQYQLDIFDRWGERIHSSNDRYAGWDGSYNGTPSQLGVYVWKIHFRVLAPEGVRSEERIGHVTLLR